MPYNIEAKGPPDQIVEWLAANAGPLMWGRPNVEWKGRGWTMHAMGFERGSAGGYYYLIRLDDPKVAALAALRWS